MKVGIYMISWMMTQFGVLFFLLILVSICALIENCISVKVPPPSLLATIAFIFGLSIIVHNIMTFRFVSESTEPWRQIYNNELDAPVSMTYHGQHAFSTNSPLTDDNLSNLRNIYYNGSDATILIGSFDDSSSRTIRIAEIEGDLGKASTITKIEYRKATTVHRKTAWLTGEPEPANYQGDVRITLGNKNDNAKTNSLFGD